MINFRKAVMVGCGFVGSASVFALMQSGLFSEIAMIDADMDKAEGEAMDISHGIPFAKHMRVYAGDYDDVRDAGIVIVTAGANQKPDETRLDLVHKNVGIFKAMLLFGLMEILNRIDIIPLKENLIFALGNMSGILLAGIAIIYLYNGERMERGRDFSKWFFYVFYPGHLLVLGLIRIFLV